MAVGPAGIDATDDGSQPDGDPTMVSGALGGGKPGISGGTGFFHSLVGTLLTGMASRAAQGAKQAIAQSQGNPRAQAMSAGIRAPEELQQQKAKEQEVKDEATLRQQRIAVGNVQMVHMKHLMAKENQETRDQVYNVNKSFTQAALDDGKVELIGGTTEDDQELQAQLRQLRLKDKDSDYRILNMPGSDPNKPLYQIGKISEDPFGLDVSLPPVGGHDESGLPPTQTTISKGTGASKGAALATADAHQAMVDRTLAKESNPDVTEDPPQKTLPELITYNKSNHIPMPKNFGELYMVARGEQDYKTLPKTSGKGEIGQDRASVYIDRYIARGFSPEKRAMALEMRKSIDKVENNYAEEGGKNAAQAVEEAQNILNQAAKSKGSVPPDIVQRASALLPKAQAWDTKYQTHQKAMETKKDEKVDFNQQKILFDQRQNEGQDQTGQKLTLAEADMTTPVDEWGNPIPLKKASFWKAGEMANQTVHTAQVLISKLDEVEQELKAHSDYVGPIGGTVGELAAHFGLGAKEAQKLYDNITTAQSGFTKVHTSRFSKEILAKATTMLNPRMNLQQALGAIESMRDTAGLYMKDDKLMSKAEYLRHLGEIKTKRLDKAQSYLQKAGWTTGKPTDDQKLKAKQLAAADGQQF